MAAVNEAVKAVIILERAVRTVELAKDKLERAARLVEGSLVLHNTTICADINSRVQADLGRYNEQVEQDLLALKTQLQEATGKVNLV